jgi:hypothetical protein
MTKENALHVRAESQTIKRKLYALISMNLPLDILTHALKAYQAMEKLSRTLGDSYNDYQAIKGK